RRGKNRFWAMLRWFGTLSRSVRRRVRMGAVDNGQWAVGHAGVAWPHGPLPMILPNPSKASTATNPEPRRTVQNPTFPAMSGFYSNALNVGLGLTANLGRFDGWRSRLTFLWSTLRHALVLGLRLPLRPRV